MDGSEDCEVSHTQTPSGLRQSARCDAAGDTEVVTCTRLDGASTEQGTKAGQAFKELLERLSRQYEADIEDLALKLQKARVDLEKIRGSQKSTAAEEQEDSLPNMACLQDATRTETKEAWAEDQGVAPANSSESCDMPGPPLGSPPVVRGISNSVINSKKGMRLLDMMKCWDRSSIDTASMDACRTAAYHQSKSTSVHSVKEEDDDEKSNMLIIGTTGVMRHFIGYPSTPMRLAWEIAGAFLIFYDLVYIPLSVFERKREVMFNVVVDWFTMLFWTFNVLMTLTVGYVCDGVMIMDPARILVHYLRTWFVVDLIVVVPDWVFTIASLSSGKDDGSDAGGGLKVLRILRLVRMVRLLRLFKLRKIMQLIQDMIDSEHLSIFANVAKMLIFLLIMCHVIGCIWFALGNRKDRPDTWVQVHNFDDPDMDWSYQYLSSLHWSITQFTPASMHLQPQNVYERIYALAIVVFGLVVFSYVVGSITSSLGQLRAMQEDAHKQFWHLRRYLKQNKIDKVLAHRLLKYLEHAFQSRKERLQAKDIKIFGLLSEQLHSELVFNIEEPHLKVHPLFEQLGKRFELTMQRIAKRAIANKMVARTDTIFIPGEKATHMGFVTLGTLHYYYSSFVGADEHAERHDLELVESAEDWISEPVLWTSSWTHRGNLVAESEAELTLIIPKAFEEVIHLSPPALGLACIYARNYVTWANENLEALSDIAQGELVSQMCIDFLELSEGARQRNPVQKVGDLIRSSMRLSMRSH